MPRTLRVVDATLTGAVAAALAGLTLQPEDAAAARLARFYAEAIDRGGCECDSCPGEPLRDLGPKLLAVLESLGATPKARAAALKGVTPVAGRLAAIRAARA
jgi:hypothetical protein